MITLPGFAYTLPMLSLHSPWALPGLYLCSPCALPGLPWALPMLYLCSPGLSLGSPDESSLASLDSLHNLTDLTGGGAEGGPLITITTHLGP